MAAVSKTIKKDIQNPLIEYQRSAPSPALPPPLITQSIWDRLPYNISMEYHQKLANQQQKELTLTPNSSFLSVSFQQLSSTTVQHGAKLQQQLTNDTVENYNHTCSHGCEYFNEKNCCLNSYCQNITENYDEEQNCRYGNSILKDLSTTNSNCSCCLTNNHQNDLLCTTNSLEFLRNSLNNHKNSENNISDNNNKTNMGTNWSIISKKLSLEKNENENLMEEQHICSKESSNITTSSSNSSSSSSDKYSNIQNVMMSFNDTNNNQNNQNLQYFCLVNFNQLPLLVKELLLLFSSNIKNRLTQILYEQIQLFLRLIFLLLLLINKSPPHNSSRHCKYENMQPQLQSTNRNSRQYQYKFNGLFYILMMLLTMSGICTGDRHDGPTNCTFPQRWEGSWFLSGYLQSIQIKGSQFSLRGKCAASDGNKYLIVDEKGCHRCLVIYEKHKNVLQYKESECEGDSMYMDQSMNPAAMRSIIKSDHNRGSGVVHPNNNGHSRLSSSDQFLMRSNDDSNDYFCKGRETLQNLCDQIPGDALLYSLFRMQAEPVKCPLKGPFTFTYNRGHGECKSPSSNIDSCTEESRLLLSFQACPDVYGTESTVEELTCLATWKDGNSRYLVGLVSHHRAISNEERFRCFVYEKISTMMAAFPGSITNANLKDAEYKLAQSGDATCNGLDSAEVGSRIMTLRKPPAAERCDFPTWFKGPRHWHALMANAGYQFHPSDGSMHITKSNGYLETRALCEQINKQTSTEMMAVVHYTTGCQSGFMCMMFYRRDTHVAEVQIGTPASRLEDACAPDHFDIAKLPYTTLLASNPEPQICPLDGLYQLRGAIGPPYITSRHKRNHNTNYNSIKGQHNQHNHHHHEHELKGLKRHSSAELDEYEKQRIINHRIRRNTQLKLQNSLNHNLIKESKKLIFNSKNYHTNEIQNSELMQISARHSSNVQSNQYRKSNNVEIPELHSEFVSSSSSDDELPLTIKQESIEIRNNVKRTRRDAPEGCIVNYKASRQLWVGCTEANQIDVRPFCSEDGDEVYYCHGSWTENGTSYIIAKHAGTQHGVCLSYRLVEGNSAKLIIGDGCYRGFQKPPDHHLIANLTNFGKCGDSSSSSKLSPNLLKLLTTLLIMLQISNTLLFELTNIS